MLRRLKYAGYYLPRISRAITTGAEVDAFIAIGSNIGDRVKSLNSAVDRLRAHMNVTRTSFLYESEPMYITDQPRFINGAVQVRTSLSPQNLLKVVKDIEASLGRDFNSVRCGPRPMDLDIVTYGESAVNEPNLQIPHPRFAEREFVLRPLCDINPTLLIGNSTIQEILSNLESSSGLVKVTPLPSGRLLRWGQGTILMGVVNATPDSFSDGGENNTVEMALRKAEAFIESGFHIIDIGGQSTRPGASYISVAEEIERVIHIIQNIRTEFPGVIISCDTLNSHTAQAAIRNGADIVNDISAGTHDEDMLDTMATSHAAAILVHMRGTSKTMQSMTNYDTVVHDVTCELRTQIEKAMDNGVNRWSIISDPGIGFAKTVPQNWVLLGNMYHFRTECGGYPTLLGVSRKSLFKELGEDMYTRDWCTAGVVSAAVMGGGVDMVRVHNEKVAASVKAVDLMR